MVLPDAAVGSIIAAIIGGLVVFISAVLSKEQKTSEFRQAWIDELRKDVSQYMSGATEVAALNYAKKQTGDQVKFLEDNFALIHELQSIEHRILLRLNPTEHADLIEKIKSYRKKIIAAYADGSAGKVEPELADALLETTGRVLKYEWARVKSGENTFRIIKVLAVTVAALGVLAISFVVFYKTEKQESEEKGTTKVSNNIQQTTNVLVTSPTLRPKVIDHRKDPVINPPCNDKPAVDTKCGS